ncbi:MAG: Hpt domain-containing protein [Sulfitobacter sp.]|nr:Hpt domain-containing protein [Sulfitobacter sp.]
MISELPGLDRVRARFLDMLVPRHEQIAAHAVAAWDGETVEEINGNLAAAQAILHQIAGTAGSLGLVDLGAKAHACENEIIDHLKGPDADLAICPGEIIRDLDEFLQDCLAVLESSK